MAIIDILNVKTGKQVTFTTTPPADDVTVYRGDLFTQVGSDPAKVVPPPFLPSQLEGAGAVITVDDPSTQDEVFVFVISATATAATTIKVRLVLPTSTKNYTVNLATGLNTAEWVLVPR